MDFAQSLQDSLQSGNWSLALGLIYLVGLATSLTPCVYPMIAITVSIFGAKKASTKKEAAFLSGMFVLGIAALLTPLGVVAAMTGGAFGSWLANPWVLVFLALFFVAMSLSMFGLFELQLPSSVQAKLEQMGGVGPGGAFLMGLVNALIAAPCTGPGLLALLTWIGITKAVGFGALALFVYALGLGTLFFFVGTFAISLPKSGKWMTTVKSIFGVVMFVMALYYLREFFPFWKIWIKHTWVYAAAGGLLLLLSWAIGGFSLEWKEKPIQKTIGIAIAKVGGFILVAYMILPPPGTRIRWINDYDMGVAIAKKKNKPILVDFGAAWCGACGELERNTFTDSRIVLEAERFVSIHMDLTSYKDKEKWDVLKSYNQKGLPLVVMGQPGQKEQVRVTEFVDPDHFYALMRQVR